MQQNQIEKYALEGKSTGGNISQMIWESFVGKMLGPIAFINGIENTQVYIDILANTFLSTSVFSIFKSFIR